MSSWNTLSVYASENLQLKKDSIVLVEILFSRRKLNNFANLYCKTVLYIAIQDEKKQDFCFIETYFVLFFFVLLLLLIQFQLKYQILSLPFSECTYGGGTDSSRQKKILGKRIYV